VPGFVRALPICSGCPASHFAEVIRGHWLLCTRSHQLDDMLMFQIGDTIIAVLDAETINQAAIDCLRRWSQRAELGRVGTIVGYILVRKNKTVNLVRWIERPPHKPDLSQSGEQPDR
jgi:hypothetical protein